MKVSRKSRWAQVETFAVSEIESRKADGGSRILPLKLSSISPHILIFVGLLSCAPATKIIGGQISAMYCCLGVAYICRH